ncbi:MAG: phosphoesterase RecJ domain protein [Cyanobacteria bacterium RYN_339]|nr:phosphoesterase RecJ domain protein [Cyanobacteria bacterium RYN_339]
MKPAAKASPVAPGGLASHIDAEARSWLGLLRSVRSWVVCPHMKPDADTLGSSLALAALLRQLGNRAVVVCTDPVVDRFGFLPGAHEVVVGSLPADLPPDTGVVTLDAADFDRLGALGPQLRALHPFVNLDHHVSNKRFGTHNWIDTASAATGELVYLLHDLFDVPVQRDTAELLYAALVTDTGFFRYPATTARTLAIASALVATGIDFPRVIECIYERQAAGAIRLAGMALAKFHLEAGGQVAWTSIPLAMFDEAGATEDDAEGIIEELRKIEGVQILYILRESRESGVRVSLRAKHGHDVNAIARQFNGGGHLAAAGCVIDAPLAEAEERLKAAVLASL